MSALFYAYGSEEWSHYHQARENAYNSFESARTPKCLRILSIISLNSFPLTSSRSFYSLRHAFLHIGVGRRRTGRDGRTTPNSPAQPISVAPPLLVEAGRVSLGVRGSVTPLAHDLSSPKLPSTPLNFSPGQLYTIWN